MICAPLIYGCVYTVTNAVFGCWKVVSRAVVACKGGGAAPAYPGHRAHPPARLMATSRADGYGKPTDLPSP
jgi:hypothetical protein